MRDAAAALRVRLRHRRRFHLARSRASRMHMRSVRVLTALAVALSLACGAACHGASGDAARALDVYTVRGKVVEVTGSGEHTRATVAHEAIPAFKDREGHAATMPAMSMAFGLAPNVPASALAPGKPYTLSFDVAWNREPTLRITAVQPLPEGTALLLAP